MTITQRNLLAYVNTTALQYEKLADLIYDAYDLFLMEIEDDCVSVEHEAELCYGEIDELIEAYRICGTI